MKNNDAIVPIVPCKFYPNSDTDKVQILKDNQKKSGVYMFTNLTNGKKYIGSSVNLSRRFYAYFNVCSLERDNSMPICLALLKYGYSKFSLGILEYCEPSEVLTREKYYLKLLNPQYNIWTEPSAPMLGRNHSEETLEKFRNRKHSEETKALMSSSKKISSFVPKNPMVGEKHSYETRVKMSISQKGHKGAAQPNAKKIMVTDLETNISTSYASINEAAKALSCRDCSILKNLKSKNKKPLLIKVDMYLFYYNFFLQFFYFLFIL